MEIDRDVAASAPMPEGPSDEWRVARNTLVQMGGRGVTMLLSMLSLMVLARGLGAEGVGDYLLVLSFLLLLNFSDMGFSTVAVRELALSDRPEALLGNLVIIRTVLAVIAMVIVCLASLALHYDSRLMLAIGIGSVSYLLMALGQGTFGIVFATNLRMEYQAIANVAQSAIFLVVSALAIVFRGGVVVVVIGYDLSVLVNTLIVFHFSRRFVRPVFRLDRAVCRRLVTQSLPVGLGFLGWLAYNRVDMVLLSKLEGPRSLGLYGMAYRFVDFSWPLGLYFSLSVYPLMAQYSQADRHDDVRALTQRSLNALSMLVVPLATVLIVFPETILTIVGSREFQPAATSLRLLSLAIVAMWMSLLTEHLLMAIGKQVLLFSILPFALAANVGLNLLLIPLLGFDAAALNTAITEAIVLLYSLVILRRANYLPSFAKPAKMATVAIVSGALALFVVPAFLPLQMLVLVVGFAAGGLILRIITLQELREARRKVEDKLRPMELGARLIHKRGRLAEAATPAAVAAAKETGG